MKKQDFVEKMHPLIKNGVAHRGYHNSNDIENGLNAFRNAVDNNLAFELDVHLTKDKELVVCHDSTLKRVTGKEGIIEELTLEEIKNDYTLNDGEKIPTLKEVFDLVQEKVPIVLEIKSYKNNNGEICKKLKEELKCIKDEKSILIIAFDPRDIFLMRKERFLNSLLLADQRKDIYPFRIVAKSIDIDYNMLKYKKVCKYAEKHFVNVWTVRDTDTLDKVLPYADTITYENVDCNIVKEKLNSK